MKKVSDEVFQIFEEFYLNGERRTVSCCRKLTEEAVRMNHPELADQLPLPEVECFEDAVKEWIPVPAILYTRYGLQEEEPESMLKQYARRIFTPNSCWVTCRWDFEMPFDGDRKEEKSLYLWMDVATRRLVGGYVTENTGCWKAGGWLEAFRRAVKCNGIPERIVTDEEEIPTNARGKILGKVSNELTHTASDFTLWLAWKESIRPDTAGRRDLNECVEEYLAEWNSKKGFFADKKAKEEAVDWTAALERFRKKMEKDREEGMRLLEERDGN